MTKIERVRNADGTQGRSWNPVRGCSRVTEGCRNCYAERMATKFSVVKGGTGPGNDWRDPGPFFGFANDHGWTGRVELIKEKLSEPLHWRKPHTIFVNSMSDLFHESLSDEAVDRVFAVMALCPQHTFIVLTKRASRMREYLRTLENGRVDDVCDVATDIAHEQIARTAYLQAQADRLIDDWPLRNLILGVSPHDQASADEMIPDLFQTPAWKRIVSIEPMLGPVDLRPWLGHCRVCNHNYPDDALGGVIVGGESGPSARPMHPNWARSVRDQCQAAGVPFFFKQWGEWGPLDAPNFSVPYRDFGQNEQRVWRVGKKAAGRLLDGREHNEVAW